MQQSAKTIQAKEKSQIKWGIELFKLFIFFISKKGSLSSSQALTLQKELGELIQAAAGEDTPESIAEELNNYISRINMQMQQELQITQYVPFPTFTFAINGHFQSAVLDQLGMIERTLTEATAAEVISIDKESSFFTEILQLFSQVESQKMRPDEGIARLINEIKKINEQLPKECSLPLPDLNAYV